VLGTRRDQLREPHDSGARLRDRKRCVVAGDHLVADRLHEGQTEQLSGDDLVADAPHERLEPQPFVIRRARTDAGVQHDESRDPLRVLDREAKADRPAPVLHDDRGVPQIELLGESRDRRRMALVRVPLGLRWLVGTPEAEVVRCDAARRGRQFGDHLAVEERPRRLAVEQQHRIAVALGDVVHPQPVLLDVVRLEGVPGQALEAFVWCAVDVDRDPPDGRRGILSPADDPGPCAA
jgi:hypothetical protein